MDNSNITDRLALLVLDMQPTFMNAIQWQTDYVRRITFAITAARIFGIRIFFTEQVPEKLGHTDPSLLTAAGEGVEVFAKTAFSALRDDRVAEYIEKNNIEHLLVTGIEVPICVYQTCTDALAQDIDVTLLTDCVAGRRAEDCNSVVDTFRSTGIHCMPAETIFYSILGNTTHPLFKNFTKEVKKFF